MIALLLGLLLGVSNLGEAEHAYRAGQHAKALALYLAALAEPDVPEGAVLYDLGNCAFRLGRHAEAALYYRRALRRLPRDHEVRFNLRSAERQLGIDAPAESLGAAALSLVDSFTPGELLFCVGALESAGLLGFALLRRRRAARVARGLVVALALFVAARHVHAQWFAGPPEGVVLSTDVKLRSEPRADLAATAKLKAGEVVRVLDLSDRWIRVATARGRGWTERAGVGLVD